MWRFMNSYAFRPSYSYAFNMIADIITRVPSCDFVLIEKQNQCQLYIFCSNILRKFCIVCLLFFFSRKFSPSASPHGDSLRFRKSENTHSSISSNDINLILSSYRKLSNNYRHSTQSPIFITKPPINNPQNSCCPCYSHNAVSVCTCQLVRGC